MMRTSRILPSGLSRKRTALARGFTLRVFACRLSPIVLFSHTVRMDVRCWILDVGSWMLVKPVQRCCAKRMSERRAKRVLQPTSDIQDPTSVFIGFLRRGKSADPPYITENPRVRYSVRRFASSRSTVLRARSRPLPEAQETQPFPVPRHVRRRPGVSYFRRLVRFLPHNLAAGYFPGRSESTARP